MINEYLLVVETHQPDQMRWGVVDSIEQNYDDGVRGPSKYIPMTNKDIE
jgi:hypothetical protein